LSGLHDCDDLVNTLAVWKSRPDWRYTRACPTFDGIRH
jgi:hypothetical protein